MPLDNDPVMLGRLIPSFRHLKHQNLSTGDDFIDCSGINFLVPFLATREAVALLSDILSCWVVQYSCLDPLNVLICPLLMQWATAVGLEKNSIEKNHRHRTEKRITETPLITYGTPG